MGQGLGRRRAQQTHFIDMMRDVGDPAAGWVGRHTVVCPARQRKFRRGFWIRCPLARREGRRVQTVAAPGSCYCGSSQFVRRHAHLHQWELTTEIWPCPVDAVGGRMGSQLPRGGVGREFAGGGDNLRFLFFPLCPLAALGGGIPPNVG